MSDRVEQLLQEIRGNPGQKARTLAQGFGWTRAEVNSILYSDLKGRVYKDNTNYWWPCDDPGEDLLDLMGEPETQTQPAATQQEIPLNQDEPQEPGHRRGVVWVVLLTVLMIMVMLGVVVAIISR